MAGSAPEVTSSFWLPHLWRSLSGTPRSLSGAFLHFGGALLYLGRAHRLLSGTLRSLGGAYLYLRGALVCLGGTLSLLSGALRSLGGALLYLGWAILYLGRALRSLGGTLRSLSGAQLTLGGTAALLNFRGTLRSCNYLLFDRTSFLRNLHFNLLSVVHTLHDRLLIHFLSLPIDYSRLHSGSLSHKLALNDVLITPVLLGTGKNFLLLAYLI